jgi:hypothetical protein
VSVRVSDAAMGQKTPAVPAWRSAAGGCTAAAADSQLCSGGSGQEGDSVGGKVLVPAVAVADVPGLVSSTNSDNKGIRRQHPCTEEESEAPEVPATVGKHNNQFCGLFWAYLGMSVSCSTDCATGQVLIVALPATHC